MFFVLFMNLSEQSRTDLVNISCSNYNCSVFINELISVTDFCPRRRQKCFSTQYFTSCIQALLLEDEKERLQEMVEYLGRKK